MWDKVKRVRAGVKANYGDDSQQFEMIGGTRTSERKPGHAALLLILDSLSYFGLEG